MIQQSVIDSAINRLAAHFGSGVVARPPASAAELAELESVVGALPRDLTIFLSTCNGLSVRVDLEPPDCHLVSSHEMLAALCHACGPSIPPGMLPLRGDPAGERDWLVLEPGMAHGIVVRWDPWGRKDELVASTFGCYFDALTHYLTEFFAPSGRVQGPAIRPPFHARYVARHDAALMRLANHPEVRSCLRGLTVGASSGDDFE